MLSQSSTKLDPRALAVPFLSGGNSIRGDRYDARVRERVHARLNQPGQPRRSIPTRFFMGAYDECRRHQETW